MKQKALSLLLAVSMLTASLVGCGADSDEKKSSTSESQVSVSTEKSEEPEVSAETELEEAAVQFWIYGSGKQKDSDEVWAKFNEKLQEYLPNTTVEFSNIASSEYKSQYSQMLAAGEAVDLVLVASWITGDPDKDGRDGNLLAVNDLMEEYGQGIIETVGQEFLDWNADTEGNLYIIPTWSGSAQGRKGFYLPTELVELVGHWPLLWKVHYQCLRHPAGRSRCHMTFWRPGLKSNSF